MPITNQRAGEFLSPTIARAVAPSFDTITRSLAPAPMLSIASSGWAHNTRIARTVVERRCRVNVSGVVTPSPVGVAMLKLR